MQGQGTWHWFSGHSNYKLCSFEADDIPMNPSTETDQCEYIMYCMYSFLFYLSLYNYAVQAADILTQTTVYTV